MIGASVQKAMEQAVADGVFPGGVLLVARGNDVDVISAGRFACDSNSPLVHPGAVYDLASLTKIISTTTLTMIFIDQGRINIDDDLHSVWPETVPRDKKKITVGHLLTHVSGLPAWRPVYGKIKNVPIRERRKAALDYIFSEPLENEPGERTVYSDLGFILLGFILEAVDGRRQDVLFSRLVSQPLGLKSLRYNPIEHGVDFNDIAPTELEPRWSGPPGGPLGEAMPSVPVGTVHDDNARGLSGVAGHAGLFGKAEDVWTVFNSLRRAYKGEANQDPASSRTVMTFWRRNRYVDRDARAFGYDAPSRDGSSSAGTLFAESSVGHTGYTGTSLWYDPEKDLTVILLTNRVHPSADNTSITAFRPKIHDLIVNNL